MDHPPSEIIARQLIAGSIGTNPAAEGSWPVFASHLGKTPINAIAVYDQSGIQEGRDMGTGFVWEKFGLQFMVRGEDESTVWTKAEAVKDYLDGLRRVAIVFDSKTYLIHAVHRKSVILLGMDPDDRSAKCSINALATLAQR